MVNAETKKFEKKIKEYASIYCIHKDNQMLARLGDVDFVAKEIDYHGICRGKYQTQSEQISKKKPAMKTPSNWHKTRSLHDEAFKSVSRVIEEEIINKEETYIMNDLNDQYVVIFSDLSAEQDCSITSTTQPLETKIKQHFKNKVHIQEKKNKTIFNSKVTVEEAL